MIERVGLRGYGCLHGAGVEGRQSTQADGDAGGGFQGAGDVPDVFEALLARFALEPAATLAGDRVIALGALARRLLGAQGREAFGPYLHQTPPVDVACAARSVQRRAGHHRAVVQDDALAPLMR